MYYSNATPNAQQAYVNREHLIFSNNCVRNTGSHIDPTNQIMYESPQSNPISIDTLYAAFPINAPVAYSDRNSVYANHNILREAFERELKSKDWKRMHGRLPSFTQYEDYIQRNKLIKWQDTCIKQATFEDYINFLSELESKDWIGICGIIPTFQDYVEFLQRRVAFSFEEDCDMTPTFIDFIQYHKIGKGGKLWTGMLTRPIGFGDFLKYTRERGKRDWKEYCPNVGTPTFKNFLQYLNFQETKDVSHVFGRVPNFLEFMEFQELKSKVDYEALCGVKPTFEHMLEFIEHNKSRDWDSFCGRFPSFKDYLNYTKHEHSPNWITLKTKFNDKPYFTDYMQFKQIRASKNWIELKRQTPDFEQYIEYLIQRSTQDWKTLVGRMPNFVDFTDFQHDVSSQEWVANGSLPYSFLDFMKFRTTEEIKEVAAKRISKAQLEKHSHQTSPVDNAPVHRSRYHDLDQASDTTSNITQRNAEQFTRDWVRNSRFSRVDSLDDDRFSLLDDRNDHAPQPTNYSPNLHPDDRRLARIDSRENERLFHTGTSYPSDSIHGMHVSREIGRVYENHPKEFHVKDDKYPPYPRRPPDDHPDLNPRHFSRDVSPEHHRPTRPPYYRDEVLPSRGNSPPWRTQRNYPTRFSPPRPPYRAFSPSRQQRDWSPRQPPLDTSPRFRPISPERYNQSERYDERGIRYDVRQRPLERQHSTNSRHFEDTRRPFRARRRSRSRSPRTGTRDRHGNVIVSHYERKHSYRRSRSRHRSRSRERNRSRREKSSKSRRSRSRSPHVSTATNEAHRTNSQSPQRGGKSRGSGRSRSPLKISLTFHGTSTPKRRISSGSRKSTKSHTSPQLVEGRIQRRYKSSSDTEDSSSSISGFSDDVTTPSRDKLVAMAQKMQATWSDAIQFDCLNSALSKCTHFKCPHDSLSFKSINAFKMHLFQSHNRSISSYRCCKCKFHTEIVDRMRGHCESKHKMALSVDDVIENLSITEIAALENKLWGGKSENMPCFICHLSLSPGKLQEHFENQHPSGLLLKSGSHSDKNTNLENTETGLKSKGDKNSNITTATEASQS